jgi:hypothetical protein
MGPVLSRLLASALGDYVRRWNRTEQGEKEIFDALDLRFFFFWGRSKFVFDAWTKRSVRPWLWLLALKMKLGRLFCLRAEAVTMIDYKEILRSINLGN